MHRQTGAEFGPVRLLTQIYVRAPELQEFEQVTPVVAECGPSVLPIHLMVHRTRVAVENPGFERRTEPRPTGSAVPQAARQFDADRSHGTVVAAAEKDVYQNTLAVFATRDDVPGGTASRS